MVEKFPYGKAPFWLLVVAVLSTIALAVTRVWRQNVKPDISFALFAPTHLAAYESVVGQFERRHGLDVGFELVNWESLQTRLQNAMLAGSEVPDMVEIGEGALGFFTRGPLSDVGFVDLTDRIEQDGLDQSLVASRFSLWSARGRIFGLPHDVHPVVLAYRRDLVEQLGIDVSKIRTWDDFVEIGRRITKDLDGDGVPDRYMLDMPNGGYGLQILLYQRGGAIFDEKGALTLDNDVTAETIRWYLEQLHGPRRIAFDCGWRQPQVKALTDGLVLFMFAPDWRTKMLQEDAPHLAGKMALVALPAWHVGGRRTSVWGGTGLVITKSAKRPELAWELAKFLYLDRPQLGKRFLATNIIPPFKDAWNLPEFKRPSSYYSNQPIGSLLAELAPATPAFYSSPHHSLALAQLDQAYGRALEHYKAHGDTGLREVIRAELGRITDYMKKLAGRQRLAQADL
jgi:arabinosaccharide transport system substrate-binding protein